MAKVRLLKCPICTKEFNIVESQYKYRIKAGRTNFYCSLSCAARTQNNRKHISKVGKPFTTDSPRYTALKTPQELLESSMREFTRRFRSRSNNRQKLGESTVTIDHLVEVWNAQQGRCCFTGVKLSLPRNIDYATVTPNYKASVDRIDNEKGYVNDNIRFVSHTVNNLRNSMSDELVYEFFELVK